MKKLLSLPPNLTGCFHEITGLSAGDWFCTSDPAGSRLGSGGGTAWLLEACMKSELRPEQEKKIPRRMARPGKEDSSPCRRPGAESPGLCAFWQDSDSHTRIPLGQRAETIPGPAVPPTASVRKNNGQGTGFSPHPRCQR